MTMSLIASLLLPLCVVVANSISAAQSPDNTWPGAHVPADMPNFSLAAL
jgi:hypothetical protein